MSFDASSGPFLVQLRADLAACAAWVTEVNNAGQESAHIHHPHATPSGAQGFTDPLPIALLTETSTGFSKFAEGASGLLNDKNLTIDLYLEASTAGGSPSSPRTAAYLEALTTTLITQLYARTPQIIPYKGQSSWTMSSEPTPGAWASDDSGTTRACAFHHITIRLPAGFNV